MILVCVFNFTQNIISMPVSLKTCFDWQLGHSHNYCTNRQNWWLIVTTILTESNKKFELTKRAKAYSSSGSVV